MLKEDKQKRITSGGLLGFDHFVQQYPKASGCYECYGTFERKNARKKDWSHDHSTCDVCQSLVKAKQQTSKGKLPRLAVVLETGWKGLYGVELTNEWREKEKEMLKFPPKSTPSKGKVKENDKHSNGSQTAAK